MFSLVQFRWLFFGNVAFFFSMQGQMLTRSLLAWELTGEATALAYINLVVAIPLVIASLFGGAITDRVERRRLIIFGQSLIVANEVFILVLLLSGQLEFWHMLCTAFIAGCAFPFIMPARMAITIHVVGPQRLQRALAFQAGAMNLNRVLGPAVMGIVIAQFSFTAAYILSISLYACAISCMFGIEPSYSNDPNSEKKPLLADIAYGFKYILDHRPVLICLLFGLVPMFLVMPFQNILVVLAEEAWQAEETGVGMLMATMGIGGVLGAIWIARRDDHAGRLKIMIGSTFCFGIFLAIFTQTGNFYLALIPLLLGNICASASQTVNNAAVQLLVDDSVRGRMSSFMMLSFGLTPIGVFPLAVAADNIGAANAILGACILLMATVIGFFMISKTLRSLDQSISTKMTGAN
ncbi:MAG: MFS transporter [Gammaproteobacteria bacterium]|nr:MFS transporter [Gammaproteobacteria bacterium]MDD9957585.1 MFS transporter [Gammaproteobacteria bacterium]